MLLKHLLQISKIAEHQLCHLKFSEFLNDLTNEEIVSCFLLLHDQLKNTDASLASIHLGLIQYDHWRTLLGKKRLHDIYLVCVTQGQILLSGAFIRDHTTHEEESAIPDSAKLALSKLTLGEKKQQSRLSDRKKIDYLLYDSHPFVVEQLLNNPRVLEKDILKMLNLSLKKGSLLKKVYQHPKWLRNLAVQKALMCHKALPNYVFALLLHHMPVGEILSIKERIEKNEIKRLLIQEKVLQN